MLPRGTEWPGAGTGGATASTLHRLRPAPPHPQRGPRWGGAAQAWQGPVGAPRGRAPPPSLTTLRDGCLLPLGAHLDHPVPKAWLPSSQFKSESPKVPGKLAPPAAVLHHLYLWSPLPDGTSHSHWLLISVNSGTITALGLGLPLGCLLIPSLPGQQMEPSIPESKPRERPKSWSRMFCSWPMSPPGPLGG
jgi:hypothetical protein